ncbi:N-acetylmuramoyl-L-alanine amidase [Flavihumibacter solisilvae]|uniref:Peptidoglycan-binding protein n=1 Tax=Flavihumibacter solisilvae TaxID=1349421 RepID=A0A0C1LJD9_9BACT|nr:N-acetylmuramoyl-L-alanine amidase [Flavihumibacter solisilvae]KIC95493.1 peptidoglycan-binding protein [Flavihumibacter solisilvae]
MPHSLIWLPRVLKNAGLKIAVVEGWESRGPRDMGEILGVMCHHTAGPRKGNMPSLNTLINGRTNLSGPLSQLGLGRDGTYYIISAGRCNHAGPGIWRGLVNGNSNFIGIEAENTGKPDDLPWPEIQLDAYRRGVAAILKHVGRSVEFCASHREYARPPGRKSDVSFDMNEFRSSVAAIMNGTAPAPVLIPATEPVVNGVDGRPTLRRGANGGFVRAIQQKFGIAISGVFNAETEALVREFQRANRLVPDGIVGPKTWKVLDAKFGRINEQ